MYKVNLITKKIMMLQNDER